MSKKSFSIEINLPDCRKSLQVPQQQLSSLLRLAAAHNGIQTASKVLDVFFQTIRKTPEDPTDTGHLNSLLLWLFGLVKVAVKTVENEDTLHLLEAPFKQDPPIKNRWKILRDKCLEKNGVFHGPLGRIRDKTAFHLDREVFEKPWPDPGASAEVFACQSAERRLRFPLADKCIIEWVWNYAHSKDGKSLELMKEIRDYADEVCDLLKDMISLHLATHGCKVDFHKFDESTMNSGGDDTHGS